MNMLEVKGLAPRQKNAEADKFAVYDLADGGVLVLEHLPAREDGSEVPVPAEVQAEVQKVANCLGWIDSQRRATATDDTLTDIGRQKRLLPALEAAQVAGREALAKLGEYEFGVRDWEAKIFAPPALEPSNIVDAMVDAEIRTHARSLDGKALTAFAEGLRESPRHISALLRSPVPLDPMLTSVAKDSWAESIRRTHPDALRLADRKAALAWASSSLLRIIDLFSEKGSAK